MRGIDRIPNAARRGERGNAMVVSLLVLFLLTSLGVTYVAVTKGDKQIAGNQAAGTQAFAHAEAGISEALLRMSNPNTTNPSDFIGQPNGNWTAGYGRYIVSDGGASALDPRYDATLTDGLDNDLDAAVDESSEHYPETGSRQNNVLVVPVASKLDYPWVKVRYKLDASNNIVLFGDHDQNPLTPPRENLVRGMPVLVVTGSGRKGVGSKIVTVEAVKWPLPPVPGSVYTEGSMNFQGNAFYIDGHDHNYTAPYDTVTGAPSLPGIATPNDPTDISNNLNAQQQDNVAGSGSDPSVQSSSYNLDLQAMADAWSQIADLTFNGSLNNPSTSGWGDVDHLKVVHVKGDLSLQGSNSGAGVLIIDGDFHLGGSFNYNGVVIVLQNMDVVGGGSAKNIVGCLMVQGTLSNSTNVNGNVKVLYSSGMISKLYSLTQYEVSSWIDQ